MLGRISLGVGFFLLIVCVSRVEAANRVFVPRDAAQTHPVKKGALVPDANIRRVDGTSTSLKEMVSEKPTILIFYRGGWCPFCNTHLGELSTIQSQLDDLGYQMLAVSPDRPQKLKESSAKHKLSYTLLSDSQMHAAKAFGLAFRLDDETVKMYKEKYNIDVEADSGETHHMLPVPAAYVIDPTGMIQFSYTNPDYKVRVNVQELLDAAREAARPM